MLANGLANIALEDGVFEYRPPPYRAAMLSAFVKEEQGFRLSHCSISTAKNSQIRRGVDTRQRSSFDCAPSLIASSVMLWHVTYLKRVTDEVTRLFIAKKQYLSM